MMSLKSIRKNLGPGCSLLVIVLYSMVFCALVWGLLYIV